MYQAAGCAFVVGMVVDVGVEWDWSRVCELVGVCISGQRRSELQRRNGCIHVFGMARPLIGHTL